MENVAIENRGRRRFQVRMIMGKSHATLVDLLECKTMHLDVDKVITEGSFYCTFREIVQAMIESGIANKGDQVVCTTFPEGSIERFVPFSDTVH
jgi:hypothetical protein